MAVDTIRWEDAGDGVVNLVLDDPNQSANTMNADFGASMRKTVERLEAEKDAIAGVVITSAKKTFFAGGDLNDLKKVTPQTADEFSGWVRENKSFLRRLETLGKPVVACINGAALGGGLEIALACHRRIVVDDPKIQLGQPEVQLGLLPGAGGVVRVTRMLGIVNGLMQVLLQGQRIRPAQAKEIGLVDELVSSPDELVPAAKQWIADNLDFFWIHGEHHGAPAMVLEIRHAHPYSVHVRSVHGREVRRDDQEGAHSRLFLSHRLCARRASRCGKWPSNPFRERCR